MKVSRVLRNHDLRLSMLQKSVNSSPNSSSAAEIGKYTYPKGSKVINPRHFYQNTVLMDWVQKDPRPISLRQLAFFGRKLTPERIISSANFVRQELPVRLAHRIRDMQTLPFAVMNNPYMVNVYEMYYKAFDEFRKTPLITTLEDNNKFCEDIHALLDWHSTVIPQLAMGIITASQRVDEDRRKALDVFMSSMLSSRISRRVIAEQHLSLTKSLISGENKHDSDPDFIGEVFLQLSPADIVTQQYTTAKSLIKQIYPDRVAPELVLEGHLDTKFPYIPSHFNYIIGELVRNSIEATVIKHPVVEGSGSEPPPPILVSISNTPQNVFIRLSDHGGGIDKKTLPHIWEFTKVEGARERIKNFQTVPHLQGLPSEVKTQGQINTSLTSLAVRPPQVKLGLGLPLSRVYAEYWDGALELNSLENYGCDVYLKISRLGNQNERLQLDKV